MYSKSLQSQFFSKQTCVAVVAYSKKSLLPDTISSSGMCFESSFESIVAYQGDVLRPQTITLGT